MKITYRQRIFTSVLFIFLAFTAAVILIEQRQEKQFRTASLEARLDGYTETVHAYIANNRLYRDSLGQVAGLYSIFPDSIRLSVIDSEGVVLLDNEFPDVSRLANHLDRPEIRNAGYSSHGSAVRFSASTHREYLYYARSFGAYYVRVALPYDMAARKMLEAGNLFIYTTLILFAVVLLMVNYMAGRFGKSIRHLKDFASAIKKGKSMPEPVFPKDELGAIGHELIAIFKQSEQAKQHIGMEKEKLIRHFRFSGEGLCIFSPEMKKIYANTNFIQYINLISDHPSLDVEDILAGPLFRPVTEFITSSREEGNSVDFQIKKNAKTFSVQAIVFKDKSFEIIIKDITKAEKTKLLKQEMTANIAHELRTPVTSLRGYLETLAGHELEHGKQKQFIERAFLQAVRLSNLIEDTSIISKIEDAPSQFTLEQLDLQQLIGEVRIDLMDKLEANHIRFASSINGPLPVKGNYTLLYSVFRNLVENSITYAGPDIEINIANYAEDENDLYFSYYDTGPGVEERHLSRLFERFYRVNEGRTRDTGGSGLGLSIVKNAILFHKGSIQVKNRPNGGLEFLFTLGKQLNN